MQLTFLALTFFIGYRFYCFVLSCQGQGPVFPGRPPSVEAFLPIAGLMSMKYFLFTGVIEPAHPAAFIMFVAIVLVSVLLKKGFCGWICPVGTVSQYLWMAGQKMIGRNYRMERYTDIAARSVKYLLLGFFFYVIGLRMSPDSLSIFFSSEYYKTADIRTMMFFTEMSPATFWSLAVITGLSLIYKNAWCRYLCPYGALLGLLSALSPLKIRRNEKKCIHCSACTRNCPTSLPVEEKEIIKSPECFGCMTCVSHCPAKGALELTVRTGRRRRAISPYLYIAALVLIFSLVIVAGILSGTWRSAISDAQYRQLLSGLVLKTTGHP